MKYEGDVRMWQYNKPLDLFDDSAILTSRTKREKSQGFNE